MHMAADAEDTYAAVNVAQSGSSVVDASAPTQAHSMARSTSQKLVEITDRIPTPYCHNMLEHPDAVTERSRLNAAFDTGVSRHRLDSEEGVDSTLASTSDEPEVTERQQQLSDYIARGLAYTAGSALGYAPPSEDLCLQAFLLPNKAGLTAGARAWSKHAHRSGNSTSDTSSDLSLRWWGSPSGPVTHINERAIGLFWKVWRAATWRNLHWLPHQVLVYEVRVPEGYGMRWAQDWKSIYVSEANGAGRSTPCTAEVLGWARPWVFRGFVEPMMENGHERGWRH